MNFFERRNSEYSRDGFGFYVNRKRYEVVYSNTTLSKDLKRKVDEWNRAGFPHIDENDPILKTVSVNPVYDDELPWWQRHVFVNQLASFSEEDFTAGNLSVHFNLPGIERVASGFENDRPISSEYLSSLFSWMWDEESNHALWALSIGRDTYEEYLDKKDEYRKSLYKVWNGEYLRRSFESSLAFSGTNYADWNKIVFTAGALGFGIGLSILNYFNSLGHSYGSEPEEIFAQSNIFRNKTDTLFEVI